jgi:glutamate carboxypeptidase
MAMTGPNDLIESLQRRTPEMLEDLGMLVEAESPSTEAATLRVCAEVLASLFERHIGQAELLNLDDRVHVHWGQGEPQVLVLGHFDTVWPLGTVARWGFSVTDGRATGPGIFDMKAGIVQGLYGLAALGDLDGVEVLFTADEEIGGPTSRAYIQEAARRVGAVLVLEPSAAGAVKIARKGGSLYRVTVTGRAAHAGLEPEKGVNAIVEAARQILAVAELADFELGTTVTPSIISGGSATNTVPAAAFFQVDVRSATAAEQDRVEDAMQSLIPITSEAQLTVGGGIDRPPLPESASADLFERAQKLAADLGLGSLEGVEVGGGSDGNFTAAVGTQTLDGLGAVGAGAHAEGEWIDVGRMAERAALVARLVDDLRHGAAQSP